MTVGRHLRVGHEDVHAVFRVFLVLALRLEHETLQDVVVPRHDAAATAMLASRTRHPAERDMPYFELGAGAVVLEALRTCYLRDDGASAFHTRHQNAGGAAGSI